MTVTDAEHLLNSKNKIRVRIVADTKSLSREEKDILDQFIAQGGTVYACAAPGLGVMAYPGLKLYDKKKYTYEERVFMPYYSADDLPELTGIVPIAQAQTRNLGVQVLQGEGYTLLSLTNLSPLKKTMDAKLRVSISFTSAEFASIDKAGSLRVNGSEITVENMTDGGILILR